MSDCGWIAQVASERNEVKPGYLIFAVTIAQVRFGVRSGWPSWHSEPFDTSNVSVLPAITPPTRRSPPSVRPNAFENAIFTVLPDSLLLPPAPLITITAAQASTTNARDASRRIT